MSWHYSQALAAAYSAASCSAGALSAPSNGMTTQDQSSKQDRMTDALNPFQSGTMCKPSMGSLGADWWISSLAASRARTSQRQIQKPPASTASEAACGHTWRELWVKWCHASSSWKTHQCLWEEVLPESSVILPRWGIYRLGNGQVPAVVPLAWNLLR